MRLTSNVQLNHELYLESTKKQCKWKERRKKLIFQTVQFPFFITDHPTYPPNPALALSSLKDLPMFWQGRQITRVKD